MNLRKATNALISQYDRELVALQERKAAEFEGYTRDSVWLHAERNEAYAQPFIKTFWTGIPHKPNGPPVARVWAKKWWWLAFAQARKLPNKVELLTQLKDLWERGETEKLEAHLGGIELAGDSQ